MKVLKVLLIALILMLVPVSTMAVDIVVDGAVFESEIPPIVEDCTTYLSVRDMAKMLDADMVEWHGSDSSVTIGIEKAELRIVVGSDIAYIEGKEIGLSSAVIARDNRTYLPVRAVTGLFGAEVSWESGTGRVIISFEKSENDSDLLWLARIVHVEAGRESYEGRLAVANVILNRVKNSKFPNTIYDVIFQPKQFPPAAKGELDNLTPNEGSLQAAKDALAGVNNAGECLYFCAASQTATSWVANNRTFFKQIGNHCFYY